IAMQSIEDQIMRHTCFSKSNLKVIQEILLEQTKSKKYQKMFNQIKDWMELSFEEKKEQLDFYCGIFLDSYGLLKKTFSSDLIENYPILDETFNQEALRVQKFLNQWRAWHIANFTRSFLDLGRIILQTYEKLKTSNFVLTYDDLINKSLELLRRPDIAPWILYKLDGGIDHILVDEAQDVTPEQWAIITSLVEEFFYNKNSDSNPRTIFSVGDVKQSIYRFQGANPDYFIAIHHYLKDKAIQSQSMWHDLELQMSFRSSPILLQFIDIIFSNPEASKGLKLDNIALTHIPYIKNRPGLVELWPLVKKEKKVERKNPWNGMLDNTKNLLPAHIIVAQQIAKKISEMINCDFLECRNRYVQPGDFLILVRKRNQSGFADELIRALKNYNIPVSGIDRIKLTDQLVIMDLIALGQFVLLEEDDFNLALVLKGPLVGLTEEELFDLGQGRSSSLWKALQAKKHLNPYKEVYKFLTKILNLFYAASPYEFYSEILNKLEGRKKLLSRLGQEAEDALDEFMNLILNYEEKQGSSLQSFLQWLIKNDIEVKRDFEQDNVNYVRFMTVHGAKGLQAPIIFLPDTTDIPYVNTKLFWEENEELGSIPFLVPSLKFETNFTKQLREKEKNMTMNEYRRLLYVALTRAEERLYIMGWENHKNLPEESWYSLIKKGFEEASQSFDKDTHIKIEKDNDIWRLSSYPQYDRNIKNTPDHQIKEGLPYWFFEEYKIDKDQIPLLSPSLYNRTINFENSKILLDNKEKIEKFERGIVIHKLLENINNVPRGHRNEVCEMFLKNFCDHWPIEKRNEIKNEVLNFIHHEQYNWLFDLKGQNEISVKANIKDKHNNIIRGIAVIDRLIVLEDEILVLEYKSDYIVPLSIKTVKDSYLRQVAFYVQILKKIYSNKKIRSFLLWTRKPKLMELDPTILDHYKP
ncbi:MAG: UvrD-helicase domain-containing protein, partial [Alphaproteobacteria bacterium]|nr:UvrD-helicase domain-containing protein [Alphaproteobacteria bacterium]